MNLKLLIPTLCVGMTFLLGCATSKSQSFSRFYVSEESPMPIEDIAKENPPTANESIHIQELGRTPYASYHLVQIRDREQAHIHQTHEAVARLESGEGIFVLGRQVLSLKAGDVILIPKGKPHFFVNRGKKPAVAWVIFIPAFDGKDYVPLSASDAEQDDEKRFVLERELAYKTE